MILVAILVSTTLVIPTIYLTFEGEEELDDLTIFLYAIYPILDGIILAPSIIAVMLFFRGQVNFLWTLILYATMPPTTTPVIGAPDNVTTRRLDQQPAVACSYSSS